MLSSSSNKAILRCTLGCPPVISGLSTSKEDGTESHGTECEIVCPICDMGAHQCVGLWGARGGSGRGKGSRFPEGAVQSLHRSFSGLPPWWAQLVSIDSPITSRPLEPQTLAGATKAGGKLPPHTHTHQPTSFRDAARLQKRGWCPVSPHVPTLSPRGWLGPHIVILMRFKPLFHGQKLQAQRAAGTVGRQEGLGAAGTVAECTQQSSCHSDLAIVVRQGQSPKWPHLLIFQEKPETHGFM